MLKNRRAALVAVPAVVAAMALSACQEEAPSVGAPSAPSQSTQAQSSSAAASTSEAAPSTSSESSSSSSESSSSSSSSSGSASGKECRNNIGSDFERRDVEAKPLNTVQTGSSRYGSGKIEIKVGAPEINSTDGDSYFPGDGMETVIYQVTVKASGTSYVHSELQYGLTDENDEPCKKDIGNTIIPESQTFQVDTLRDGDTVTKKVAFAVPAGADLSKYSFLFASDYSSGDAELAWKGK